MKVVLALFLFLIGMYGNVHAQMSFPGVPFITSYNRGDYKAGAQNYSAVQDSRGRLYVGNGMGVLVFTGNFWQIVPVSNKSYVRSLAVDASDCVYVGAYQEFGYLDSDEKGNFVYTSLSNRIKGKTDHFADIWKICILDDKVYFQSKNLLFIYQHDSIKLIEPKNEFEFAFQVGSDLFISDKNRGLQQWQDSQFFQPSFGAFFADKEIRFMIETTDHRLWIGTHEDGLFQVENNSISIPSVSLSNLLIRDKITCGISADPHYFLIGTVQNGVYLVDYDGNILLNLNAVSKLQDNTIENLFLDKEHNLWIMHANGIDYAEIASGNFILASGIGSGYASSLLGDELYLGTNRGLYKGHFYKERDNPSRFSLVPGTVGQVWSIFPLQDALLVGHHLGAFQIDNQGVKKISDVPGHWQFTELKQHPLYYLAGTYTGYVLYKKQGNSMTFVRKLGGFDESCRISVQDEHGGIWMSHGWKGIYYLRLNAGLTGFEEIIYFNENNGLPSNLNNDVFVYKSNVYISTINGIYSPAPDKKTLVKAAELSKYLQPENPLTKVLVAPDQSIWNFSDGQAGKLEILTDSIYYNDIQFLSGIVNDLIPPFEHVNWYNQRDAIIGTRAGFVHWSGAPTLADSYSFACEINMFEALGEETKISLGTNYFCPENLDMPILKIPFSANNVRIMAGVNSFVNTEAAQFSYRFVQPETNWSSWSSNPWMEFNQLKEGNYTLQIKARNHQLQEARMAQLSFTLLPPWYRSWYAYVTYFIMLAFLAALIRMLLKRRESLFKQQLMRKQEEEIKRQEAINQEEKEKAEQELIRLRNEKLRDEVIHKSKELANSAHHLIHKNQILIDLKTELRIIGEESKNAMFQRKIRHLSNRIDKEMENDKGQEVFQSNFDRIHENFMHQIRIKHPELTPKDLQLCSYLRMNMTTKEIAPLLNISIRGVEISRYRLRKKLNLPHDNNLTDYILNFKLNE